MRVQQRMGRWGEAAAAEYLVKQGYEILARNLRTAHGEIDLVARQGEALVFVEVKARASGRFGHPEEAVTLRKQAHILSAAESYLQAHPEYDTWRVDVVSVEGQPGRTPQITHFENVVG